MSKHPKPQIVSETASLLRRGKSAVGHSRQAILVDPPGAKNKTTQLVEQLLKDEAETLTRKLIQLTLKANAKIVH